jgi:hypothetical protein
MFVCEKCHGRDEIVTKCAIPFGHHSVHVMCQCDVCGKVDILAACWAYNYLKKTENAKCLSAKNAMN